MLVTNIVSGVNAKLAGEMLTFNQLRLFLSETVDDINAELNAKFPTFDELTDSSDYTAIPDNYIRSVIITGAAYKFYTTDEEGARTAEAYERAYTLALFKMLRDYSNKIPEEYRDDEQGYVVGFAPNSPIQSGWNGW